MKTKITKIKKLSIALCLILLIQTLSILFFNIGEVKAAENWKGYVLTNSEVPPEGKEYTGKTVTKTNYTIKYGGWVTNIKIPNGIYVGTDVEHSSRFSYAYVSKIIYDNDAETHGSLYITAYLNTGLLEAGDYYLRNYPEFVRDDFYNVRLNRIGLHSKQEVTYYLHRDKIQVDHSDMLNDSKRYTFIKRLYLRALHRGASEEDLKAHFNKTTLQEAIDIMLSQEAKQKNDLSTNEKFVTYCYDVLLGRQPDAGGKAAWTNALNNGTSRSSVINSFIQSSEFRNMYN